MNTITPKELKSWMDNRRPLQLIDVREPEELEICSIGGKNIPIGRLAEKVETLDREIDTVLFCRSGQRAGKMVQFLEIEYGFRNLYNLDGGLLAWSKEVDPQLPIC